MSFTRGALGRSLLLLLAACSGSGTSPTAPDPSPGPDVTSPVPVDQQAGGSFSTYKGLPLRLLDTGSPVVSAVDGIIGVVCIGMSNSNQECADYRIRVEGEFAAAINPAIRVVNCAVGGHAIERWIDPAFDATLWEACLTQRLPQAGVRPDQVRVLWHKAANQFTTGTGGAPLPAYPDPGSDFEAFRNNLDAFAARVPTWFPAVRAVYTSSRSYGGFANSPGRGEPLSYEEGHALNRWLETHSTVGGVWHGWGPYLWAPDCASGTTNGSGTCYVRTDYVEDGVHPGPGARQKISNLLHDRWLREAWYRR